MRRFAALAKVSQNTTKCARSSVRFEAGCKPAQKGRQEYKMVAASLLLLLGLFPTVALLRAALASAALLRATLQLGDHLGHVQHHPLAWNIHKQVVIRRAVVAPVNKCQSSLKIQKPITT